MVKLIGCVVCAALTVPVAALASERMVFDKVDTDKGRTISRDELVKADLVAVPGPKGSRKVVHRDMIGQAEAVALTEEQKHALFDRMDSNKDGQISRKEWRRASPDGFILLKF